MRIPFIGLSFKLGSRLRQRRQWHPTPVLLPGKSHGRRSLVGCSPWGREESDTTERLHFHFSLACIGEGNGNPLQCSCLENPRDRGARWAAVYGVTQSRTRLKWLSSSMYVYGFPGYSKDKESALNVGDPGSILGSGRSPGVGNGDPLQYSCLENSMGRGTWWATIHGVTESVRHDWATNTFTFFLYMYICVCKCVCHTVLSILYLLNVHVVKCTFNVYNNPLRTVLLPSFCRWSH